MRDNICGHEERVALRFMYVKGNWVTCASINIAYLSRYQLMHRANGALNHHMEILEKM